MARLMKPLLARAPSKYNGAMRGLAVTVLGLAAACTFRDLDLSGRACPCVAGWVCRADVCVREEADARVGTDAEGLDSSAERDAETDPDGMGPDSAVDIDGARGSSLCPTEDTSLLGCWTFDGDLLDRSPHGRHLVSSMASFDEGVDGLALVAPPDDLLDIPRGSGLLAPELTIEMWVNADGIPPTGERRGLVEIAAAYGVFLHVNGNVECKAVGEMGTVRAVANRAIVSTGEWTHIACTLGPTDVRVYVDGDLRADVPGPGVLNMSSGPWVLGSAHSGDDPLEGRIDTARVFAYARSQADIAEAARR